MPLSLIALLAKFTMTLYLNHDHGMAPLIPIFHFYACSWFLTIVYLSFNKEQAIFILIQGVPSNLLCLSCHDYGTRRAATIYVRLLPKRGSNGKRIEQKNPNFYCTSPTLQDIGSQKGKKSPKNIYLCFEGRFFSYVFNYVVTGNIYYVKISFA